MIEIVHTEEVARSAAHAFDVAVRHHVENHPRWEDEVDEIRDLDGFVGLGHRFVMVRTERGRTRAVTSECVEYVDGARAAFSHPGSDMDFWIAFDFVDVAPGRCAVTATVRMTPKGAFRLMSPVLRLGGPRRSARISRRMARVVEETPAYSPEPS